MTALDLMLAEYGTPLDVVLAFEVEESQLVDRLSHRGRSDDDPETIRERFRQYKRLTQPVMDYYRRKGLLQQIAAVGTQDEVFARVRSAIDAAKQAVRQ